MTDSSNLQSDRSKQSTAAGHLFTRRFTSSDHATRTVLLELIEGLSAKGVCDDDLANIELILAEALNNVVEHAYTDAPGPVELLIEIGGRGLSCQIVDNGHPIPSGEAPDPPLPTIEPPADIPEGGFGWHIIRCLTTDLSYKRDGSRNTLYLLVPLADLD